MEVKKYFQESVDKSGSSVAHLELPQTRSLS